MTDDHDSQAETHHHDTHEDVLEARAAVVAAVDAVRAADTKMDGVIAMLGRHFRLGVVAVATAILLGGSMLYVVVEVKNTQDAFATQADATALQAVVNEVEVLRHRVHSKEGDLRLCTVALGASRGEEAAAKICVPVLGPEYEATKAKLAAEEARLERLRRELK